MIPLLVALAGGAELDPLQGPLEAHLAPASFCGSCHAEIYAQWSQSRHAAAWTSPVFRQGFIAEPEPVCVWCHAPLKAQTDQILANLPTYRALSRGQLLGLPEMQPETLAAEGVGCTACHLREGEVLVSREVQGAAHPTRVEPSLSRPDQCRSCHEFKAPGFVNGALEIQPVAMQSTWSEWVEWGGDEPCQACHMPGGSHRFHGSDDRDFLRSALRVSARPEGFLVESVEVGHHLPTGDLFRHLTLEVRGEGGWEVIARFGRRYDVELRPEGDDLHALKRLIDDTSLRPHQPATVPWPGAPQAQWRLRYHATSEEEEARSRLPQEELVWVLLSGP